MSVTGNKSTSSTRVLQVLCDFVTLFLNFINVDTEDKEKNHSVVATMLGIISFGYYHSSLTILVKRISVIRADNKACPKWMSQAGVNTHSYCLIITHHVVTCT